MGYNKFIRSGKQLELYEYEQELNRSSTYRRGYKRIITSEIMGDDREGILQYKNSENFRRRRDNAQRASRSFGRIVSANLVSDKNPLLITLTFRENRSSISDCSKFFHLFTIRCRRSFGSGFRYVAVPEFQRRGAVHYHALFWGFPDSVFLEERQTRFLAKLWSVGFVYLKQTDGHARLSSYLAKYMVKAISDPRLFNSKAYFASRNVLRPVVNSGFPSWWFEDEYPELSTLAPVLDREYMTQWLGKGRYRLFNL